jgi:hypothetical protein
LLCTTLISIPAAQAENVVEVLKPLYRTADELQPILQNIIGERAKVQSFNNKLVVSGSAGMEIKVVQSNKMPAMRSPHGELVLIENEYRIFS